MIKLIRTKEIVMGNQIQRGERLQLGLEYCTLSSREGGVGIYVIFGQE